VIAALREVSETETIGEGRIRRRRNERRGEEEESSVSPLPWLIVPLLS
jgi:hypothetical protein